MSLMPNVSGLWGPEICCPGFFFIEAKADKTTHTLLVVGSPFDGSLPLFAPGGRRVNVYNRSKKKKKKS